MSTLPLDMNDIKTYHAEIDQLFLEHAPVLVEVRSPAAESATRADWYLLEASAAFWGVVANSKPNTEFYLLSVHHLEQVRSHLAGTKVG